MKKRLVFFLLVITIVFGCVACAGPVVSPEPTDPTTSITAPTDPIVPDVPAVNPDADPEEIFTKTIHDFEGYRVENLDEQEDTNFVVYTPDVKQITTTASTNVLQSVDENTLTYTFKNPDAAMKALKAGDVFYIPVSKHNPETSAMKVKTIQVSGDTVTLQSDTVTMEDLFTYIDIDVYLDPAQVYQENDGTRATRSATFKSLFEDEKDTTLSDIYFGRYVNFALGTGSSGLGSSMDLGCDFNGTLRNTRVQLRYSAWDKYFSYDVSTRLILDVHTSLDCSGVIKADKELPLLKVPVGTTGFAFGLQAVGAVNLSATASGQWGVVYEYDLGASYYPDKGMNTYFTPVSKANDGELSFEGSFELSVGIKATFGIPNVVNAYIQGDAGWEMTGEFAEIESVGTGAEYIHGCEKCIDGDVNFFVRASAGISADILKETVNIDLGLKRDIAEKKWKLGDFYCALDDDKLYVFGWTECPYKRWKVEVKVQDEDGNPVNDAEVYYTDTDGTTDYYYTNAQGVATFYLLDGTYTMKCMYEGREYSKQIFVDRGAELAISTATDETKIYFYWDYRIGWLPDQMGSSIDEWVRSFFPNAEKVNYAPSDDYWDRYGIDGPDYENRDEVEGSIMIVLEWRPIYHYTAMGYWGIEVYFWHSVLWLEDGKCSRSLDVISYREDNTTDFTYNGYDYTIGSLSYSPIIERFARVNNSIGKKEIEELTDKFYSTYAQRSYSDLVDAMQNLSEQFERIKKERL